MQCNSTHYNTIHALQAIQFNTILLQMGNLLSLGPVITVVPSISQKSSVFIRKIRPGKGIYFKNTTQKVFYFQRPPALY